MKGARKQTALLILVVILAAKAMCDFCTTVESADRDLLSHDHTVNAPGFVASLDLSADGKRAAFFVWAVAIPILDPNHHVEDTGIYFLDVTSGRLSGPDITDKPLGEVTLSADGELLLIRSARVLHVYETNPIKLAGQVEASRSCRFSGTAAFAPDSKSIWIRCLRDWTGETPLPVALQLGLPDLSTIQTIRSGSHRPALVQHNGSTIISRNHGTVLVDLVAYPPKKPGLEKPTFWVRCLQLAGNNPCFDDLPLNLTPAFSPEITAISDDLTTVAVGPLATEQAPTRKNHIAIYGTASGELLRNIDIPPVMAKRRMIGLALTPNAGLLIGAFKGETKTDKGGLVAWDVSTGRALQIIKSDPVLRLSLSAAGHTLISVTEDEIQKYKLRF